LYVRFIKPVGDFFAALVLLFILSPIILVTIVLLLIANRGKIFFFQQRPGLMGKPFYIIKFKTMKDVFDETGKPLKDELRITKVGSFVRSTSLDELLQLINVLKGEMSIVGPRPLLMQYLKKYNEEQAKRHLVKPGITGWAQVNGRNAISWDQKFKMDVEYVKNITFFLDVKILFKTINIVFNRSGINNAEHVTMEEFRG